MSENRSSTALQWTKRPLSAYQYKFGKTKRALHAAKSLKPLSSAVVLGNNSCLGGSDKKHGISTLIAMRTLTATVDVGVPVLLGAVNLGIDLDNSHPF